MRHERWLAAALFGGAGGLFYLGYTFGIVGDIAPLDSSFIFAGIVMGVPAGVGWWAAPFLRRDAWEPQGAIGGAARGLVAGSFLTTLCVLLGGALFGLLIGLNMLFNSASQKAAHVSGLPYLAEELWSMLIISMMGALMGVIVAFPALPLGAVAGVAFYWVTQRQKHQPAHGGAAAPDEPV